MINIDVLLKAAEFLESQLILNSDASSSSSSSTTSSASDLAATSHQPLQTPTTHNNCGYSSSSSSGYSSTESNERTSISSTQSNPYGTMHLTSRHMNVKSTVNTKAQPHILSTTTNGTTSTGRRNGYQAKRLVYGNSSKIQNKKDPAINLHHPYARTKSTSQSKDDQQDMSKYQQNISELRIEEIKRDKAIHNTLEKNRRAHLKECFEFLQNELPHYRDKKVTNLSILNYTLKYLQNLTRREKENELDKLRLEKKQARLNERLNSLINELKTENIDYAAFLENCPANENEEDETSTSTASETQAHYDDDFENMMDYEEDEEDENGGVLSSSTNKYTIDDYEDTESDTAFSRNRKRKISSTSKQTSKYTDESTDSISSDVTVEIYTNDDHEQQQKRPFKIYEPIKKAYIKHHYDPITQQKLLTQVTSTPQQMLQQPPTAPSINLKHYQLNGPSTTPTVAQLNGMHNSQSREILQKVLMNDQKVQIKQITTETNQAQPHIKTTIIANPCMAKHDDMPHESYLQQQQSQHTTTGLVKRARSSRPATVNQLLSNNQIRALNLIKMDEASTTSTLLLPPPPPLPSSTTTQITLINKSPNDNTSVPQILVKHQASTSNNASKLNGNNVLVSNPQSNESIYQTFKNGFKSTNGQFTNTFKFNLNSSNHLNHAITQPMQILNKQKTDD